MYPQADVPVTQISIQPARDAAHHLRMGAALAPLAAEGVLVLGSGHLTHNLGEWMQHVRRHGLEPGAGGAAPDPYVAAFCEWVEARLRAGDTAGLAAWERLAPQARRAHPTVEHFLPLLVAWAAAGAGADVERIDAGVDAGVLAMDAYVFTAAPSGA
jgi:4,5-DOPA dioxygenase extradiol